MKWKKVAWRKAGPSVLVLCALLAVGIVMEMAGAFRARADANIYQLDVEQVNAEAQRLGTVWHGAGTDTPTVVDFGGGSADAPIAGMDQWLAHSRGEMEAASLSGTPITGAKKVVVLRVYFKDYTNTSTFTQSQVQALFDRLDQLWQDTSYGQISINHEVSTLFQLPDNRDKYIDDFPDGDLSNGGKYYKVLSDAVANAPSSGPNAVDFSGADAVFVLMAETNNAQFHRGQANKCSLPIGSGGANRTVGCGIFSENPSEGANLRWGRWAHEMGHAFQAGGPAHPSNYNSEFELMDSNYPGQTGVFEKQDDIAFPGWLPPAKYVEITSSSGGEQICLWAEEYKPGSQPNPQAIKAKITDSLYYMISVRRRVLGDDLNGDFANGIPDEGVLIERVSEGSDPWVTVKGKGGNRNALWKDGDLYDGGADGIQILIGPQVTADEYCVTVRYDKRANQPDVMLAPWTSAPGNTWETTDIWVDSPVNGYGTYRYGTWSDLRGGTVPKGNGDDPAIGMVNRLYARVRNVGTQTATDVVVRWQITDPPGVGIAGANGWADIGSVDKTQFPTLASIPPGGVVDVYIDWTPNFPVSDEDLAAGRFYFHTCVRVKLDHVANETVFGNQDGDREQENINYFQAVTNGGTTAVFEDVIRLRNDDLVNNKFFYLSYESDLPPSWVLDINHGVMGIELGPDEVREIPIVIKPQGTAVVGSVFGVDVKASWLNMLVNDMDPKDKHPEMADLGGVRVESRVLLPVDIRCSAENFGEIVVSGKMTGGEKYYDPKNPFQIMVQGIDAKRNFIPDASMVVPVAQDGSFTATIFSQRSKIDEVACLFAGTTELASASSGYVRVPNSQSPLPSPTATRKPKATWTPKPVAPPTGPTPTPTPKYSLLPYNPSVIVAHPVISQSDLGIFGIEITQGIQCFDTSKGLTGCPDNSLPVVAGKLTAARVYLKFSHLLLNQRNNVPVRLYMSVDGGPWQAADSTAKALKTLDQSQASNSANFIFTVSGPSTSVVRFYAVVDPDSEIAETHEGNNRYPSAGYVTMTFRSRRDLKIISRPLDYHPSGYTGTRQASGWAVNGGGAQWYNQVLPLKDNGIDHSVASGFKDWTTSLGSSSGQHALIQDLNGEYALLVIFGVLFGNTSIIPDHIYGWAPNSGYSGGHADMPVYPHAGGLGVVGIGSDQPGTSTDSPGRGALIFGHELTHDYDVKHTNTADSCGSSDSSSAFPYSSSSIQEFGFNPATLKVYNPATTHDLMSYCPAGGSKEGWISPYTWSVMFNDLSASSATAAEAAGAQGDVIAARPGVFTLFRTAHSASVIVNAVIQNPDVVGKPAGQLGDLYRVDSGFFLTLPDGDYAIELRNNGQVLASHSFTVNFESEYHESAGAAQQGDPFFKDPNPTDEVGVSLVVPWDDNTTSVALVYQGQTLDERAVTTAGPSVVITDPVDETTWPADTTQSLSWKASDADGGPLTYSVFYSNDAGQNWQLIASGLSDTTLKMDVNSLAGGPDTRFRVVASDGINTGMAETPAAIEVPNKAPQPVILEPVERGIYSPGSVVVMRGGASDMEDGTIPDSKLVWSSDRQGEIGIGSAIPINTLEPGEHTITLTATDSLGIASSTSKTIFVGFGIYLPSVLR